jgi:hypothetical protein
MSDILLVSSPDIVTTLPTSYLLVGPTPEDVIEFINKLPDEDVAVHVGTEDVDTVWATSVAASASTIVINIDTTPAPLASALLSFSNVYWYGRQKRPPVKHDNEVSGLLAVI